MIIEAFTHSGTRVYFGLAPTGQHLVSWGEDSKEGWLTLAHLIIRYYEDGNEDRKTVDAIKESLMSGGRRP